MQNATVYQEARVGRRPRDRAKAIEDATTLLEVLLGRGLEATFLLEDVKAWYENVTVLRYSSIDYQLPLLASNARYRCGVGDNRRAPFSEHAAFACMFARSFVLSFVHTFVRLRRMLCPVIDNRIGPRVADRGSGTGCH